MGFLFCVDGIPAFHQKHKGSPTLTIAELINLSLAPHIRYNPDNMNCFALIPSELSPESLLKFFQYIIRTELNPLQTRGVPGPDGAVKVKLFAASLDLKGKEKFYNQISVQGYCGCSTCCVHFDQGPDGPIYGMARCYLPRGHPLRSRQCRFDGYDFEFRNDETRSAPAIKTTQTLFNYATIAKTRGVEHYLGQKGPMMLASLKNIEYHKFNLLEWMHGLARAFDNMTNLLVGSTTNFDVRARRTSENLGIFRPIWPSTVVYLSTMRCQMLARLTNDQIASGNATWCRKWLRVCAIIPEAHTAVRDLRANLTNLRDRAVSGQRIPLPGKQNPLPYRLSPQARKVVNRRVCEIIYPHYTPVCHVGKDSFINDAGCWRTASKLIAFLVFLVPVLVGYVSKFRRSLRSLIWGLRMLEGETFSVDEANKINLEHGFLALEKEIVPVAEKLIVEGLCMIEGSVAVCLLVPAFHTLCHYPWGADLWGLLRTLWMIYFERYNKKCKNLTSNKHMPYESLANALVRDSTARFFRWMRSEKMTREPKIRLTELVGDLKPVGDMDVEVARKIMSILSCGCRIGMRSTTVFSLPRALIGGKRFNAGERLIVGRRCGSVVTMVKMGRSVYGLVKCFYRVCCSCNVFTDFVVLTWFPPTEYPDRDPLTVRISLNGVDVNNITSLDVVPLYSIQPSRVAVRFDRTNDCMYVMRLEGLDKSPLFNN